MINTTELRDMMHKRQFRGHAFLYKLITEAHELKDTRSSFYSMNKQQYWPVQFGISVHSNYGNDEKVMPTSKVNLEMQIGRHMTE